MDIFCNYKNLSSIPKLIKYDSKEFIIGQHNYKLFTYTLNVPRNKNEDDVYSNNPDLLNILPRACSILTLNGTILTSLEGPNKFSGRTNIDEDPEDDNSNLVQNNTIYDHSKVLDWSNKGILEIVETEKANGKFAICKLFVHADKTLILCGSKNYHIVTTIDNIAELIEEQHTITRSILTDIRNNYPKLVTLMDTFNSGYSLVGELCDGQHFTLGDNTIHWFSFFKNGTPYELLTTFKLLTHIGLNVVKYNGYESVKNIDNIFMATRLTNGEGSVLYCKNTATNEYILVKTKSVSYIVKRFARQVLLKGYKELDHIRNRFIEAQTYHCLNTQAAIEITHKLFKFAFWMMKCCYPVTVLGFTEVSSIRGVLKTGFAHYWHEFLDNNDCGDIEVTMDSFGTFNNELYLSKTELYPLREYNEPVKVIFLQGLQGSGKSTIGDYCCKKIENSIYIEQDMYWGDTLSCQGALYHHIASANGPKVIFITRCNINLTHYRRYLDICHKLPTIVTFFTPIVFNPLYFMISLAGIISRSQNGDNLMVGRFELPINDVVSFTKGNYDSYERHPKAITYETHINNHELLNSAKTVYKRGVNEIIKFVNTNNTQLLELRLPIEDVCKPFLEVFSTKNIVTIDNPTYIGAAISKKDKYILLEVLDKYVHNHKHMTTHLHHMTQLYVGGKLPRVLECTPFMPGEVIKRHICALVIRKNDKACAFRMSPFPGDAPNFHITAIIPKGVKPMASNSFIGLNDDSVMVIDMDYEIKMIGFWKA